MSMEYMPEGLRMNAPENRAAYANLSAIRESCERQRILEARALGVNLLDAGHYATENVICDRMAQYLSKRFPEVSVLVSHRHKEACACV